MAFSHSLWHDTGIGGLMYQTLYLPKIRRDLLQNGDMDLKYEIPLCNAPASKQKRTADAHRRVHPANEGPQKEKAYFQAFHLG